jgi:hypothetical protein
MVGGRVGSSKQGIFIHIPYQIFYKYFHAMWVYFCDVAKYSLLTCIIFCHGSKVQFQNTKTNFFWGSLWVKMVVQNCIHKLRDILKIANHIKKNHEKNLINPSKDVKNTTYSRNDIDCTMKLFFPISSLDVFHQQ